jgi:hypothetical protein
VWLTLEIRHAFRGEFIGFGHASDAEWYAYSAAWLVFAAIGLAVGLIRGDEWLRRVSLAGVGLVVAKVFLSDMAALEGVLRAVSFLGLGGALIGIGYAYRRLKPAQETDPAVDGRVEILVLFAPMERVVRYVVLFSIAVALPASAQTAATPGTVTQSGVVSLDAGTTTSIRTTTTNGTRDFNAAATSTPATGRRRAAPYRLWGLARRAAGTGSSAPAAEDRRRLPLAGHRGRRQRHQQCPGGRCVPHQAPGMEPFVTGTTFLRARMAADGQRRRLRASARQFDVRCRAFFSLPGGTGAIADRRHGRSTRSD